MQPLSSITIRISQIILTLTVIFAGSCTDPQSANGSYNIAGTIIYQDVAASGVALTLEDASTDLKYNATTDGGGNFDFLDVREGDYKLIAEASTVNGANIGDYFNIQVDGDLTLDNLRLPSPIRLNEPDSISNHSITLNWSRYEGNDFYEYRVYRHYLQAIDHETGELIYIATSQNDTTFTDNDRGYDLDANEEYYYRIYVQNSFGRVSGSNILKTKTLQWANEESFTAIYSLETITNFSSPGGTLSGVDSDSSNLWLVTMQNIGGYYDNNIVKVFYYNYETNTILKEFEFSDDYAKPSGLVWDGKNVIVLYGDEGGSPRMRFLDTDSGAIIKEIGMSSYITDAAYDGSNILVTNPWDRIEVVNPLNGGLVQTFTNPLEPGANFGITHRPGEIWLSNKASDELAIIDEAGVQIGYSTNPILDGWSGHDSHLHLAFHNDKLVMIKNSRVYIFTVNATN